MRARSGAAAAGLIAAGGRAAATTRAVSAAAGVQPPALYRHFGDLRGLLDAVARETLAAYLREKAARDRVDDRADDRANDPVEALRRGWDRHVAFGLAHPEVYALIYGDPTAAEAAAPSARPAARDGEAHLQALGTRAAEAGRLRASVPHAVRLIAAAGNGVTLALIAAPPAARDPRLSAAMREAVLAAITVAPAAGGAPDRAQNGVPPNGVAPNGVPGATPGPARVAARAVALRAVLAEAPDALTAGERQLLGEWLDRLADDRSGDRVRHPQGGG